MSKIPVITQKGEKKQEITLPKSITEIKENKTLLAEAIRAYLSNLRQATRKVKTRGEVRGGGKKPWRQKGTGRARAGSIRSPLWKGGGVVFGPTGKENFKIDLPKKKKKKALILAFKAKIDANEIIILDKLKLNKIKTKTLVQSLKPIIDINNQKILLVISEPDEIIQKSARNLPNVMVVTVADLNAFNILNNEKVCFTKEAFDKIIEKLSK